MQPDWVRYLIEQRGLSEDTIKLFQLGYCTPSLKLDTTFGLAEHALVYIPDKIKLRNSIIIPIIDLYGMIVGVQGRNCDTGDYDGTSFVKTNVLFGLCSTWQYIIEKKHVFIVEGPFDVMYLYDKGIKNVVGLLGVTLSDYQLELLARFAEKIYIMLDGDKRGQEEAVKIEEKIVTKGMACTVIQLPHELDPDDYVRKYGTELFHDIEKTEPIYTTLTRQLQWPNREEITPI